MAIKINFLANTRDVVRDVGNIGDALSDVSSSLDDVAHDAARSGSRIGDAYTDAAADGERAAERLERSFREASDATAQASAAGSERLAHTTRESTQEASESVGTFKDEAKANLSEVASSFNGDMTSVVDLVQGTLGGVVADLGPIGLIAGAAAAVGVGLIGAKIAQTQEEAEAFKAKVADLAAEMIDTGQIGETSFGYVVDKLKELATTSEKGETNLRDLKDAADESGSSYRDLAQAYAGNTDDLERMTAAAKLRQKQLEDESSSTNQAADGEYAASIKRALGQETYTKYLEDATRASKEAQDQQELFIEAGGPALERATEGASNYADAVQSAYADAGSAIEDYVEDGSFNLQKYTQEAQKQADAISAYQANMVTLSAKLSADALAYVESLGPDAAPAIQAFVNAPLQQQRQTADVWNRLGSTSGQSYNSALQGNLNAQPASKTVTVYGDTSHLKAAIAAYQNSTVTVNVKGSTSPLGKRVY